MTPATTETAPGLDEYIRDHRGWPVLGTALLAPVVALTRLDPAGLSETWHLVLPAVAAVVLYRSSTMRWGLGGSALAGAGGALLCVLVGLLVLLPRLDTRRLGLWRRSPPLRPERRARGRADRGRRRGPPDSALQAVKSVGPRSRYHPARDLDTA